MCVGYQVCVFFFEFLGWLVVSTYDDLKGPVWWNFRELESEKTTNHQPSAVSKGRRPWHRGL